MLLFGEFIAAFFASINYVSEAVSIVIENQ
jgi:hypothetical protein